MRRKLRSRIKSQDPRLKTKESSFVNWPSSIVHHPLSMGFTLTEVIIASTLLIIAVVPILKALTSAHVTTVIVQRRTHSLMLAQAKLDEIRACSIYNYTDIFIQMNASLDGPYLCNVDDAFEDSNLRKITVSVGYDLNSNNRLAADEIEVTLATYIARRW